MSVPHFVRRVLRAVRLTLYSRAPNKLASDREFRTGGHTNRIQRILRCTRRRASSEQKHYPADTSTSTNVRSDETEVRAVSMACRTTVVSHVRIVCQQIR